MSAQGEHVGIPRLILDVEQVCATHVQRRMTRRVTSPHTLTGQATVELTPFKHIIGVVDGNEKPDRDMAQGFASAFPEEQRLIVHLPVLLSVMYKQKYHVCLFTLSKFANTVILILQPTYPYRRRSRLLAFLRLPCGSTCACGSRKSRVPARRSPTKPRGTIWYDQVHPTSKMHDEVAKDLITFLSDVKCT